MMDVLGLDFGNTISIAPADRPSMSKDPDPRTRPLVPGAMQSIRQLVIAKFDSNVYVVSKCSAAAEPVILDYLKYHGFFEFVPLDHVQFCRERHEKAPICAALGITHFVDDRTEVLSAMTTVPHRYALNPTEEQLERFPPVGMEVCTSWPEIVGRVL